MGAAINLKKKNYLLIICCGVLAYGFSSSWLVECWCQHGAVWFSLFFYIYIYIWAMLINAFREIVNKVWLTSSTFLTEISFYFNEKLSHHPLTK